MKVRYYTKAENISASFMLRDPKHGRKSFITIDNVGKIFDSTHAQLDKLVGDVLGKEVIVPVQNKVQVAAKPEVAKPEIAESARQAMDNMKRKKSEKKDGESEEI